MEAGILAAAKAGFQGIELHWRSVDDLPAVQAALVETGLEVVSLNTDRADGFGLAAIPQRNCEALVAIDRALDLARELDCGLVHVTAGVADGPAAREAYESALQYALDQVDDGTSIGIEPISRDVAAGYFLNSFDLAAEIIESFEQADLGMIYDFYHAHLLGLDLIEGFEKYQSMIKSIQVAGPPERMEPKAEQVNGMKEMTKLGYEGWFGAEYNVLDQAKIGLDWFAR